MAPPDRCGYSLDAASAHETVPAQSCYRPTWEDHDRCVWHAREDEKTATMFEDFLPHDDEHIDGAYLAHAELMGAEWLSEHSFVNADFTNADVRDADLRSTNLEDARLNETVFTDVHIDPKTEFGTKSVYEKDGTFPSTVTDIHPLRAAAWSYRELQKVFRNNSLPRQTRKSYRLEKDARRRLAWEKDRYSDAIKRELSRWVMLYGSSPHRILLVSSVIILLCAILYPLTGGIEVSQGGGLVRYVIEDPKNPQQTTRHSLPIVLFRSLYFSVVTFATLGYGDIQPIGMWARSLAAAETIVGSLLSALLVFVLARSIMW